MKIIPAILTLITTLAIAGPPIDPIKHTDPDWKPVIGFSSPGTKGYYDKNSIETSGSGKERLTYALVLLAKDNAEIIKIDGKSFTARSIARGLVMYCEHGNIMLIGDLYYATEFPKEKDTPVHAIEYNVKDAKLLPGNKNSPLYSTLCPNYI